MIAYPPPLKAVGGARTGVAPANLLDIQDVNGNLYYWSDRKIIAPIAISNSSVISATPPYAIPAGQQVAWSFPTEVAFDSVEGSGTASATLDSAFFTCTATGPFTPVEAWAQWTGFKMPILPPGAVIQAVYPVVIANGSVPGSGSVATIAESGPAENITSQPASGYLVPNFLSGSPVSGQFAGTTLGSNEAAVIDARIGCCLWDTLSQTDIYQDLSISFIGLAIYYIWPPGGSGGAGVVPSFEAGTWQYEPWILSVPKFTFHRSLVTDLGSFIIQNVSGDTLSRDFEKLARISTLEGAFFVYRLWQSDAQASWLEVHGTLTIGGTGTDTVQLGAAQLLNPSQDDTPLEIYCETCQLQWGGRRCGSTETTECSYSFPTCQVIERPMMILNDYEKNYGEAVANTAFNVINRRRTI